MIQVELLSWEITIITSCLVYRSTELSDDLKQTYERLTAQIGPIGCYDFNLFEASCIYLSIVNYCNYYEAAIGEVDQRIKWVADEFLDLIFCNYVLEEIRKTMLVVREREVIYEAAYAAG